MWSFEKSFQKSDVNWAFFLTQISPIDFSKLVTRFCLLKSTNVTHPVVYALSWMPSTGASAPKLIPFIWISSCPPSYDPSGSHPDSEKYSISSDYDSDSDSEIRGFVIQNPQKKHEIDDAVCDYQNRWSATMGKLNILTGKGITNLVYDFDSFLNANLNLPKNYHFTISRLHLTLQKLNFCSHFSHHFWVRFYVITLWQFIRKPLLFSQLLNIVINIPTRLLIFWQFLQFFVFFG